MYRQKAIVLIADPAKVIQGTGIVECVTVTQSCVPTDMELSFCDQEARRASRLKDVTILERIPFSYMEGTSAKDHDIEAIVSILRDSGIRRLKNSSGKALWYDCTAKTAIAAVMAAKKGSAAPGKEALTPMPVNETVPAEEKSEKKNKVSERKPRKILPHQAADALDWEEAMTLIGKLTDDGRYRDSMLVASGCFLGLRISDLLQLKWSDILSGEEMSVREKKTGKNRSMRINPALKEHARNCFDELGYADKDDYILSGYLDSKGHITRQRADQILKECRKTYGVQSAKVFSTHSLRKTFGRRVWLKECEKGKGDQALMLLQNVFGHSSIDITKRYLGIRQEEILSVYDSLM